MQTQADENLASVFMKILANAELLLTEKQIEQVFDRLSVQIKEDFSEKTPLILAVMKGGYFAASELIKRLDFPLEFDYLEATRYGKNTSGASLRWLHQPETQIESRDIILVDDVFDQGVTLAEISTYLLKSGVKSLKSLVLIEKQLEDRSTDFYPNYVGAKLPNKFLFGCGMDIGGFWRNLPQVYATKEEDIATLAKL